MATKRAVASVSSTRRSSPASAARRDPLAAGTRRATGERKRRTRTPLLPPAALATAELPARTPPAEVPVKVPSAVPLAVAREAEVLAPVTDEASYDGLVDAVTPDPARDPARAPAPVAAAGVDPGLVDHEPVGVDVVTDDDASALRPRPTARSRTTQEPGRPPARRRKHRPHPSPGLSTPSVGALRRSGTRVDLQGRTEDGPNVSSGSGAAASRAAVRRSLRVVPDLDRPSLATGDAVRAIEAEGTNGSGPPVPVAGTIRPGIEDLVQAAVAALRTVASASGLTPEDVEHQVASTLAFLRRRLSGDFVVDDFGFDADFTDSAFLPMLRPLFRRWFRVEVRGIENLPARGGGLVVANHSGTIPMDSLMTQVAVHDEHPDHRHLRMLGADLVFSTPVMGQLARKTGSTLATNPDAERLLRGGELVGVWPEGFKGVGKPFSERYKLQRFGRGGFVSAAISAGVPIIPCSIVGAEEIYPLLGNMKALARLIGAPYAPITPTWPLLGPLGLIPLPSKWIIEFGAPVQTAHLGPGAADDPMLVFDLTDQIRETIQQTLYSLLMQRRSVFF